METRFQPEVRTRPRVQDAELRAGERGEDRHRSGDLDKLAHGASFERRLVGPGTARSSRAGRESAAGDKAAHARLFTVALNRGWRALE